MNLSNLFRKAAPVATAALSVYNPLLGALLNQVLLADATLPGPKRGVEKKQFVLSSVAGMAPLILTLVEQSIGKDVVNDEEFIAAISDLIDSVVRLVNSINPPTK
jgi:hypothetical protein